MPCSRRCPMWCYPESIRNRIFNSSRRNKRGSKKCIHCSFLSNFGFWWQLSAEQQFKEQGPSTCEILWWRVEKGRWGKFPVVSNCSIHSRISYFTVGIRVIRPWQQKSPDVTFKVDWLHSVSACSGRCNTTISLTIVSHVRFSLQL